MFIAQKLRRQNISAYLIYMYQVEDVIRAYQFDQERIRTEYLSRFQYPPEQLEQVAEWYANLARMMHEEGVEQTGHAQVVRNTLILLQERHAELLADPKQAIYNTIYYKALPCIVELRAKGNNREKSEIENCLDALYGATLLKMQGQELSSETTAALVPISKLVEMLSENYLTPEQQ